MAIDRITTGAVLDGAIATADIADDAVTGAKIENNPTVAGNLATGGTLAIAGHGSVGNAGTVAGTRALTVVGATDGTSSQILVGYNSSLSSKFSIRDDGYTTVGAGMNVQGNITLPSSAGIDFSGNPNAAGMSSELFDDYEEGTWTPTFSAGISSPVYSIQSGRYTKVGRAVYVESDIRVTGGSVTSAHVYMGGLPFTVSSAAPYSKLDIIYQGGFHNISYPSVWLCIAGTTTAAFYRNTDGGAILGNQITSSFTNATIRIGGWYIT